MQKINFKIENKIYDIGFIEASIEAFKDYDIKYLNDEIIVSGESEEEINEIFNEFMNFVIGVHNESI